MRTTITTLLALLLCAPARAAQTLQVYFIDVEGGQATLFVSPSGDSLLVDTGWPDAGGRDADRIVSAARLAGVKQIDYLVVTHYHMDHVGGVPQLAARIPIRTFVDHGPSVESGPQADQLVAAYRSVRDNGKHLLAKPGDLVPIRGINVQVLTAAGDEISKPLPGAGMPNPLCAGAKRKDRDPSENAQSIGLLITYGKFRMIDLGDLTWNKELGLACPNNKIGTVDVYLSTHHGLDLSGAPALVHALHPLVAIMNNGARKGGAPEAWQTVHTSPGLEDIWQLHYALEAGKANNAPEDFIANLEEHCQGNWIKLSAEPDAQFTVTNGRNGKTKTYQPAAQ
ncbi:MAG TPA: MBL fold metallo-hydrolase [Terriglobia bacterium]|nr:MBL fold metallo-hydrolase [Terriglobia bacterium]